MTLTDTTRTHRLDDDMLDRFRSRASGYDADNRFFDEDFAELCDVGYLAAAVPLERGGWGLSLAELAAQTRRLARHAPATALATSMHHYWVGLAADLERAGSTGCSWILDDAAQGEVFAAGHAESGNDVPVLLSTCRAHSDGDGYRFTGRKHFTSLSPRWTRLGVHGIDTTDPDRPVIVHGFVDRAASGVRVIETWDTLGMRATQSNDTVLAEAFVPANRIGALVPAGDPTAPFTGIMTVWALTLIANVYLGIAERAFELAVADARVKTAVSLPRGTFADHPFIQHHVAEMYLDLHGARATVEQVAADWSTGVDHGAEWGALVLSAKWRAVEAARRVVNRSMDVVGGGAFYRRSELERLYRDVRAGAYHPPTDAYAHEAIAKAALGVSPEGPRW